MRTLFDEDRYGQYLEPGRDPGEIARKALAMEAYPGATNDNRVAGMAGDIYGRAINTPPVVTLNSTESKQQTGLPMIPTMSFERKYAATHGTGWNGPEVTNKTQQVLNPAQSQMFGIAAGLIPHADDSQMQNANNQTELARQKLANEGAANVANIHGGYSLENTQTTAGAHVKAAEIGQGSLYGEGDKITRQALAKMLEKEYHDNITRQYDPMVMAQPGAKQRLIDRNTEIIKSLTGGAQQTPVTPPTGFKPTGKTRNGRPEFWNETTRQFWTP